MQLELRVCQVKAACMTADGSQRRPYSINNKSPRARWIAALVALLIAACPVELSAAVKFWTGGSTFTSNWSDSSNWFPAVPVNGDDVVYGIDSNTTNFDDISSLNIQSLTFSATVVSFTIHINADSRLMISGGGVFDNNPVNTQTLINDGGAGLAHLGGFTIFQNAATAADIRIFNLSGSSAGGNGETFFQGTSTAATATIFNSGGVTFFSGNSTAASATITNNKGGIDFSNSSTASNATIDNNVASLINFNGTTTAANATITNNGSASFSTLGARTVFNGNSTAASATIINNSAIGFGIAGSTTFQNSSTADNANITNNGGATQFASGGETDFKDTSTAGTATITNNGATVSGADGGVTRFFNTSTADNATLIANGGSGGGNGGAIEIFGDSTGGTSRIEVFGNGNLEISFHSAPGVTVGSIEGDGNVFLGANNLTVGSNNLSTAFSGAIQDGGLNGGTGGSLSKIGSATVTLSGTNTYTGATAVNAGKLLVDGSIMTSSGVTVNAGATLGGHGNVSAISGAGAIAPGNSPGILTATHLDPSNGMSFVFELTQTGSPTYGNAAASGNDVLRLTDATPFMMALTSSNQITIDFSGASLAAGQLYRGGFFTDITDTATATSLVSGATFLYTGTGGFTVNFDGFVTELSAAFASGTVFNGTVLQFDISGEGTGGGPTVPDTAPTLALLLLSLSATFGLNSLLLRRSAAEVNRAN